MKRLMQTPESYIAKSVALQCNINCFTAWININCYVWVEEKLYSSEINFWMEKGIGSVSLELECVYV